MTMKVTEMVLKEFHDKTVIKPFQTKEHRRSLAVGFIFGISLIIISALYLRLQVLDGRIAALELAIKGISSFTYQEAGSLSTYENAVFVNEDDQLLTDVKELQLRRSVRSVQENNDDRPREDSESRSKHRRRRNRMTSTQIVQKWADIFENTIISDWHPSAHVVMIDSRMRYDRIPLKWSVDNEHALIGTVSGITLLGESYLKVPTDGIYVIYNQITFNGRMPKPLITYPHCAQLVTTKFNNTESDTLLYGSTTQYRLGRPINSNRAYDSVYISGVFSLRAGTLVFVRLDDYSVLSKCKILAHASKTFFGMYRLNPMSPG